MINTALIGSISLNLSTVFYFTYYLPQLIHNQRGEHLRGLSLWFHHLIMLDYLFDLIYGFSLDLPWQYKLVSLTGVACLSIQQKQLYRIWGKKSLSDLSLLLAFALAFAFYLLPLNVGCYLLLGHAMYVFNIAYQLPQIRANYKNKGVASCLSLSYLSLQLLTSFFDILSAICLKFPLPSVIDAFATSILGLVLIYQCLAAKRTNQEANDPLFESQAPANMPPSRTLKEFITNRRQKFKQTTFAS